MIASRTVNAQLDSLALVIKGIQEKIVLITFVQKTVISRMERVQMMDVSAFQDISEKIVA